MRRSLGALLVAMALVAGACGDDDDGTVEGGSATTEGSRARTLTVQVDADPDAVNMTALKYFPDDVTVHPGDTVNFKSNFRGEPHTVSFGKTIDAAIAAFEKLTPEQRESREGPPPPEFEKLPSMFPVGGEEVPPAQIKLNQAAGQPCFLDTGDVPTDGPCANKTAPEFTGTQAFYNSGFLPDGKEFSVKLADSVAPGTYQYMCLVHLVEMSGKITVVGKDQKAQTAAEAETLGKTQIDELANKLKAAADKATAEAKPGEVSAGVSVEGDEELPAEAIIFAPTDAKVKVNGTVTWTVGGFHTISFDPPEDARPVLVVAANGEVQLNKKSFTRVDSPEPPKPPEGGGGPPGPDTPPVVVNGGTYDGTGFKNSGELPGMQYKVTFTKAGTYKYACLVHTDMEGTVTVA